jgi:hypothetical protein
LSGDPYPKSAQLARRDRKYTRKVASPKRWQQIIDAKQGPCRVCQMPAPNEMAHLIPRSRGGHDTNWNIIPLCRDCHALFDQYDRDTCLAIVDSLTDDEYAGLVQNQGEQVFEQRFKVDYTRRSA